MGLRVVNLSIPDFEVDAANNYGMLDYRETFLDGLIVYRLGNSRAVDHLVMVVELSGRSYDDNGLRIRSQVELLAVKDTTGFLMGNSVKVVLSGVNYHIIMQLFQ